MVIRVPTTGRQVEDAGRPRVDELLLTVHHHADAHVGVREPAVASHHLDALDPLGRRAA